MERTLDLLKGKLIKADKEFWFEDDVEYIGLYFSALWCPPCRGFTPKLADFYRKLTTKGHKFEVVFVSSDHDEESFQEYFETMPWSALTYIQREIQELYYIHLAYGNCWHKEQCYSSFCYLYEDNVVFLGTFFEFRVMIRLSAIPYVLEYIKHQTDEENLVNKYNVLGFPTLVILDKDGNTVTTKGRAHVMNKTGDEDELTW